MVYIGIDIGGMSIKGGLVDYDGNLSHKIVIPTKVSEDANVILSDICELIKNILDKANKSIADIISIGIGSPGNVDSKNGIIKFAANIKFENVYIREYLNKYFDIEILISNDANCAVLGEQFFGAAQGIDDILMVTLGTGVGTGIIVDGKIFAGRQSAGSEGGHICISHEGKLCSCGRRGCWEQYASASALVEQTKSAMNENADTLLHEVARTEGEVNGKVPFKALEMGDTVAKLVVRKYIQYVGEGIVDHINIFRSEVVIIGGGISGTGQAFLVPLQEFIEKNSFAYKHTSPTTVKMALLGNDAGILGAAALGMNKND